MEIENKLKCPNCLSPVIEDAETCPNCKKDFYNCSNCNTLVLETDTICRNCNSKLDTKEAENYNSVDFISKSIFLINWTVSNQSFRLSLKADTPQKLLTSYWVDIFSNITGVILSLILIYLVSNVKIWQSEKIKSKPKRNCQHCGGSIEIDALLCTNCGQQLFKSY